VPAKRHHAAASQAARLAWRRLPLALALALRLCYLAALRHTPGFTQPAVDAGYHDAWARGLALGDWHHSEVHDVAAMRTAPCFRPPGYPFFLALVYRLCGTDPLAPRLAQMALGLVSLLLLGDFARRAWGARVAWLAQLLAGSYWGLIYFEGELLEPPLLVFAATACLAALLRAAGAVRRHAASGWAVLAGLALGLHAITRPNVLLAAPALAAWLFFVRLRAAGGGRPRRALPALAAVAALTAGTMMAILPVTWRNWRVGGEAVPISSNGGINLYIGNHDGADGLFVGTTAEFGDFGTSSLYEDIVAALSRREGRRLGYREVDRYFAARAWEWMRRHPGRTLKLAGRKLLHLLNARETGHNRAIHFDRRRLPVIRHLPGNWGLLLTLCAAAGGMTLASAAGRRREAAEPGTGEGRGLRRTAAVLTLLFCGCYGISFLPFFITGQYRMPLVPWLCLGAAVALERAWEALRARDWRPLAAGLAAAAPAALLSGVNWLDFQPNLAKWHFDNGAAWEARGNVARAVEEYHAAIAAGGQTGNAWYNLGRLLAAAGRLPEAAEAYRQALRAGLPQEARAWNNLGNTLLRLGQAEEAAAALREAVAADPGNAEMRCNLATALLAGGRIDAARAEFEEALARSGGRLAYAHLQLGALDWREGRRKEAEEHFGKALELRPELRPAVERLRRQSTTPAPGKPRHEETTEQAPAAAGAGLSPARRAATGRAYSASSQLRARATALRQRS
jgi:tetratricopeptide (TPR) repeat protein